VTNEERKEDFSIAFYQHQYERVGKLETQRLTITNICISITAAVFAFSYRNTTNLSFANGLIVPFIVVFSNLLAIFYIQRCYQYMVIHRERARQCLAQFDKEVSSIQGNPELQFPDSFLGIGRRKSQILIHLILIFAAFVPFSIFVTQ